MAPPWGGWVSGVTPMSSRALELTTQEWPQARVMMMGTSVETLSRSQRVGMTFTPEK